MLLMSQRLNRNSKVYHLL
ncbi:hypothetical protein Gotur_000228 [Gossypium turneri]